jgi:hypothetical protein
LGGFIYNAWAFKQILKKICGKQVSYYKLEDTETEMKTEMVFQILHYMFYIFIKAAGFFTFNTFPEEIYKLLWSLKTSSNIQPACSSTKSGISGTVAGGTMTASGTRLATGGT